MKFSALNADFSSPSPNALDSRSPVQAGIKEGWLFPKMVILPLLAHLAWNQLPIATDMLLIITSTGGEFFKWY